MTDRYHRRRNALRRAVRREGVEALLVTHETNVTYLTGFTGDSSALFVGRGGSDLLVSDGRYETQLADECPGLAVTIRPIQQLLPAALAEAAASLGLRRLGFEAAALSVADLETLTAGRAAAELKGLTGLVEQLRAIKDRDEVAAIRSAIAAAERAFAMVRAGLRPDDTEADVADALEAALRRCGAQGSSFPPIVAVGANAALPHARPSPATHLGDAPFVLVDWGASARPLPYKSDLTRVVVTGKVTPKFEKVYGVVLEAQRRGIAAVRPGVPAQEVDAAARSVIEAAGLGRAFSHGLGHGVGLDIHEAPRLRHGADGVLRAGMVLTIEPGVYLPGWGGVRIEDDVLVTPDGAEVLTRLPRDLDDLRWP